MAQTIALREVLKELKANGFYELRTGKGRHRIYTNGVKNVAVPYKKEVVIYTWYKIKREAGIK